MEETVLKQATIFIERLFEPVQSLVFAEELKSTFDISELLINNGFFFDEIQSAELLKGLNFKSEYMAGQLVWLIKLNR